jgi:hypothetical protein
MLPLNSLLTKARLVSWLVGGGVLVVFEVLPPHDPNRMAATATAALPQMVRFKPVAPLTR